MPGIVGIISRKSQKKYEAELQSMIDIMKHETFYTSGAYLNEQSGVYAGWIGIKGSFSACMPIVNERRDLVLFFSGENFDGKSVINGLIKKGHEFDHNNAGASHLVHRYEEDGESFFGQLNGWFGGLLVNLRDGNVTLFNDRYGMHRIYYHQTDDAFYFSSEAKALLKVLPHLRRIDQRSLGEFFVAGCTLEDRSLFSDISILPGGSKWLFRNGELLNREKYFDFGEWENQPVLKDDEFFEELKSTFHKVLPRYIEPMNQVGLSITGGLDTRLIMAHLNIPPGAMPCYTFGGMYRDCFDVKIARQVALQCKQSYHLLRLDDNFLASFPELAEKTVYVTDGGIDVSVSHEIYLSRLAREISPIRLTGNYGSEVLRSVNYMKPVASFDNLFQPDFQANIVEAADTFGRIACGNRLTYAVSKLIPWFLYGRLAAAQSQLTVRTPYMDNDLVRLMYQAPESARTMSADSISLRLIYSGKAALAGIATDRGLIMGMGSLVALSRRFYREVSFKSEYFYGIGMPDWLAKIDSSIKYLHIDKLFLGRHKIESYRTWFRDELSNYFRQLLLDNPTSHQAYFRRRTLQNLVEAHLNGSANNTDIVAKIATIELIHRLLINQ